jgi:CRISPR system Cascade subunit CasE
MYLSRLVLNPRCQQVRSEILRPYEMHRTIMRAFPADLPDGERVLYRLDVSRETGTPTLLVQSITCPAWAFLAQADRYLQPPGDENPAVKEFAPGFTAGQVLAFRLRANPTVRREGKRLSRFGEEDQQAWLDRKGASGGFRLVTVTMTREGFQESSKHEDDERRLCHFAVRFEGVLTVTDPATFVDTIARGIGPGKAFGFGLLSVARQD